MRPVLMTALILAGAAPVAGQDVDWRKAGGDLFATAEPGPRGSDAASDPQRPSLAFSLASAPAPRLAPLSQPFQDAIAEAAAAHGLDPKLLHALVIAESNYRSDALSPAGAAGLTQLMPGTAAELGVEDRYDPVENLRGGAEYLARQILRFGDLRLALAAFNSGPGRVERLGRVPEIPETRHYVTTVIDCYLALSAGQRVVSSSDCRPRGAERQ